MHGTKYKIETKKMAEGWRSKGKTYSEIREKFGIPKSTLSVWFSKKYAGTFTREKQFAHLARIRPLAIQAIKRRNDLRQEQIQEKIKREVKNYPLYDAGLQKSILATLYWAEGSKYATVSGIKLANTDPALVKLFITLLRRCYVLDESRLKIYLHLHYYHKIRSTKNFWSDMLNIPLTQFAKVYIKKRSVTKRYRKNFMGICSLYYFDSNIRRELIEITKQLQTHYNK